MGKGEIGEGSVIHATVPDVFLIQDCVCSYCSDIPLHALRIEGLHLHLLCGLRGRDDHLCVLLLHRNQRVRTLFSLSACAFERNTPPCYFFQAMHWAMVALMHGSVSVA
jgi:hypothetical protein